MGAMTAVQILNILEEHSSREHPLTQQEIIDYLDLEFGETADRKTVGRVMSGLKENGCNIISSRSGSYLEKENIFSDAELKIIIDSVLSSDYISDENAWALVDKVSRFSPTVYRQTSQSLRVADGLSRTDNDETYANIELFGSAIQQKKKVRCDYNKYGIDLILHKSSENLLSPYTTLLHNQRYYVMALNEKHGNVIFYRLDHITGAEMLEESITPLSRVKGYENGIDYKTIQTGMPYLFNDSRLRTVFRVSKNYIDQVIDWFGTDIKITECRDDKDKAEVSIIVSQTAMKYWALQYLPAVEIVWPEKLRDEIRAELEKGYNKYSR